MLVLERKESNIRASLRNNFHRFLTYLPKISKNPIIVTGLHRSGTTLVGTILSKSNATKYIYEPMNPDFGYLIEDGKCTACVHEIKNWYQYQDLSDTSRSLYKHLKHLITSKSLLNKRPLFKSPFAFFLSEDLYNHFNASIVMMVRSPLGLVSSIVRKKWDFDFNDLLDQSELMNTYIQDFYPQIKLFAKKKYDLVDQGILLWNIMYSVVDKWSKKYPDWIILKHEDVAANPDEEFSKLFEKLNLKYTDRIKREVKAFTNKDNPVEADINNTHSLKRNAKENIDIWKDRLSDKDVERIKNGTKEIGPLFYPELYK